MSILKLILKKNLQGHVVTVTIAILCRIYVDLGVDSKPNSDGPELTDFAKIGPNPIVRTGQDPAGSSPRAPAKIYLNLGLKSAKSPGVSLHVITVTGLKNLRNP